MINENALVIYKGKPAIVKDRAEGKITISLQNNEQVKVREKDIELIHPGPVKNFNQIEGGASGAAIRETWELLIDEGESSDTPPSLKELAALICGEYTPASAFAAYSVIKDGLYFSGTIDAIVLRHKDEVDAEETKRNGKMRETEERAQFIERLKSYSKKTTRGTSPQEAENHFLPVDSRYIQDVEALAYGKSVKSRTMKELGLSETPEEAHSLLLKTGFWTSAINPHPSRFGLAACSANICPDAPENEERIDLCHLDAFAIDSPWSNDPDDAVSIEKIQNGKNLLYVHIADPASSVTFDSPAEKEARDRGATLYLPEGAARMLAEEALPLFALGLSEKSLALTFKMTIDENGSVIDTEIFPSVVKVRRISYEDADKEINNAAGTLRAIYDLSAVIYKKRFSQGAVDIELPDIHITSENGIVNIEPIISYKSVSLVRECMISAGEGAGTWAAERGLVFPYISQEVEIQGDIPCGLAGSWHLRRCMRPRILSTKPGYHQGLGLDTYTQVTSPLRRYTDLLAHMQIRAFLKGGQTLGADEVSARLGFSEAAAIASVQAERASNNHWLMVYLSDKKDSAWDAVAVENKGNRMQMVIPSLALETQVSFQKKVLINENVKLVIKSVNIPRGEAVFIPKI